MDINAKFNEIFHTSPDVIVRAPGRVNLLGEHIDYNDGIVLPAAIDRSVRLAATPSGNRNVTLAAIDLGKTASFSLDYLSNKTDLDGKPLPTFARYPAGVAWALQQAGFATQGAKIVYSSDIPIGSGLSSSAAVQVGFAVLWQALGGWSASPLQLAQICQQAENNYVGVSCGMMDQFASACGVEGHALAFDTRSLEWQALPLPENTSIVIADSGMRRSLSNSAYNDRRAACEKAVELLRQYKPGISALRDIQTTEFAAYAPYLPDEIRMRAEHVVKEIQRVNSALGALKRQDQQAFGALMYASHNSLRNLYEVSIPELDILVDLARRLPGIIGARLTGAGFGGCTVNLIETALADEFINGLKAGYRNTTGKDAQVYLCKASRGAHIE